LALERWQLDERQADAPRRARPGTANGSRDDVRGLASAMGNQRFAALARARRASVLAREEESYPGPDVLVDPERCAVDVCAIDTPGGAKHLFIVYTNEKGVQYGYRAGPDGGVGSGPLRTGPFLAYIEIDHGIYTAETFQDYDPQAVSVRALSGSAAMGKGDHLADELIRIGADKIKYEWYGPNSNTVVSHLLTTCGIPRVTPVPSPVGWDARLYPPTDEERQQGRGGAEGSSGEGPSGAGGASGW
jgi:hypothetical protein